MKRTIDLLRLSAKLLLVLVVVVMVSGFLTAKPALLGGSFATYRWLHTRLVPVLFVPVLFLHSSTGLLFLISRSKRWNTGLVRRAALAGWLAMGALLTALYFADPRPSTAVPIGADPGALLGSDGAGANPPQSPSSSGAAASSDSSTPSEPPRATADASTAAVEPSGAPGLGSNSASPPPPPPAAAASPSPAATSVGPKAAAASPPLNSNEVVQAKCTGCHGLEDVYRQPRSTAEWNEVLDRMIAQGAELSAAERAAVMRVMPRR